MHDPKFEKEVQKKMEELSFSPSEAVWAKVEKEINKESNRRMPLFWIFLLLGLGLAGTGTYILFIRQSENSHSTPVAQTQSKMEAPQTQAPATDQNSPVVVSAYRQDKSKNNGQGNGLNGGQINELNNVQGNGGNKVQGNGQHNAQSNGLISGQNKEQDKRQNKVQFAGRREAQPAGRQYKGVGGRNGEDIALTEPVPYSLLREQPGFIEEKQGKQVAGQSSVNVVMKKSMPGEIVPFRPLINMVYPSIPVKGLVAANTGKVAKKINLETPAKWEAGFTGGVGIANVRQDLAGAKRAYDNMNAMYAAAAPILRVVPNYPPSDIKPGISYMAGIFVRRPILKKAALSIGLNLHYYSSRILTGNRVDNISSPAPGTTISLFYISLAAPQVHSYPYYNTGDSHPFTNKYYFVELPVAIQLPLNHSKRLPLLWEGGLSVSRLLSLDALYYDQGAGVYYKDRDAYNKTQVNVHTSVMFRLSWLGGQIQVGPQFGYGLTNLFNQKADAGHLLYGGIKFNLIAGRRK